MTKRKAPRKTAKTLTTKGKALKARFDAVHAAGMKALQQHDYTALGKAIEGEAEILNEQGELIAEHQKASAALSQEITQRLKKAKKRR